MKLHREQKLFFDWCNCDYCSDFHKSITEPIANCFCKWCGEHFDENVIDLAKCSCVLCTALKSAVTGAIQSDHFEVKPRFDEDETLERFEELHKYFQTFTTINNGALRAGAKWSESEDQYLDVAFENQLKIEKIAQTLQRTRFAVLRRLIKFVFEDRGYSLNEEPDVDYVSHGKSWEPLEIEALVALHKTHASPQDIGRVMKRTPLSVASQLVEWMIQSSENH